MIAVEHQLIVRWGRKVANDEENATARADKTHVKKAVTNCVQQSAKVLSSFIGLYFQNTIN